MKQVIIFGKLFDHEEGNHTYHFEVERSGDIS